MNTVDERKSEQAPLWVPTTDLPVSPGHPFYTRLNRILDDAGFDRFAEEQCQRFYAPVMGRPARGGPRWHEAARPRAGRPLAAAGRPATSTSRCLLRDPGLVR